MNRAIVPVLATLVLALVGAGLMLGGFFDEADEKSRSASITPDESPLPAEPSTEPATPPDTKGLATSRFTAANDRAVASKRLDGAATGLVASGVVVDPNDDPLANARVALIHDVSQVTSRPQDGETLLELVTAEDGRFSFENLELQEAYVIRAEHDAFTTVRVHPIEPAIPRSLTQRIKLGGGVELSGTIVDSDGVPLNEAEITVYDLNVSSIDPRMTPERTGYSTLNGTYTVEHLRPGLKRIMVHKIGYATEGRNGLNLTEGVSAVNFVLSEGFTIRGIVTDRASRQAIEGALVNARVVSMMPQRGRIDRTRIPPPADTGGQALPGEPDRDRDRGTVNNRRPVNNNVGAARAFHVETVATDARGLFVLSGLLEARYVLSATARGYQIANGKPANAGDEGVNIEMTPSPRIEGRVVDGQTGEPVAVFTIATSPTPNPVFIPRRARQRFEHEDGRFT
ncbi:MAG: carboxypeptidase regulatory-like domain-containing protein, partial [Planctomycetes bacterium]|nr:carboxypeptidase regulatory-like domain-containing protein [Planctomycetota bacterium]